VSKKGLERKNLKKGRRAKQQQRTNSSKQGGGGKREDIGGGSTKPSLNGKMIGRSQNEMPTLYQGSAYGIWLEGNEGGEKRERSLSIVGRHALEKVEEIVCGGIHLARIQQGNKERRRGIRREIMNPAKWRRSEHLANNLMRKKSTSFLTISDEDIQQRKGERNRGSRKTGGQRREYEKRGGSLGGVRISLFYRTDIRGPRLETRSNEYGGRRWTKGTMF